MGLRESDKEYMKIGDGAIEERIEYCENLIRRMQNRLTDKDTDQIRKLTLEMIESAEKELNMLRSTSE
jgi:hypothetical protein